MFRNPLVMEITAALVLKLMFVAALWFAFFSQPVEPRSPISDSGYGTVPPMAPDNKR